MFDILIRNGTLIDGTGKDGYKADIAVTQNKISKIGNLARTKGAVEIDAKGKIIAPGFIDIHNHSDGYWRLFLDPQLPSLVSQGITSIIGGNCGASIVPLSAGKAIEAIQKWADIKQINVDWLSMADFVGKMENKKFGVNFGTLIGHGTLRRGIVHDEMRRLDKKELRILLRTLEDSLQKGAMGFSTGLAYSHEKNSPWDELVEMLKVVEDSKKTYSTHLRNEAEGLLASLEEAIEMAKNTGVNIEISHLKAMGRGNWPLMDEALEKIEKAAEEGINISFDVYPYTETGSVLYFFLPDWAVEGGKQMMLKRLKLPHLKDKIINEIKKGAQYDYGEAIIAVSALDKSLNGRKIKEIADSQGISIEEAIIKLLIAAEGRIITLVESLDEENVRKVIKHPLSIIATDGAGYDISYKESGNIVHPRCFGTFPKVLGKYVREEKLLTIEEAIKKMTMMPAKKMRISDRGILQKNFIADIVVFDAEKITDKATAENPYQYSEGISEVIISGKMAMQGGELTGKMAGEFLMA